MDVDLHYKGPPQWQVSRPPSHEVSMGAPPLVVVLTGKTPADIEDAFSNMRAVMGWQP